jgi:BNR repeat-like domain
LSDTPPDAPSFHLGGDTIIRACGVYDHGGDECFEPGGFYKSVNRGKSWDGPYRFTGLEQHLVYDDYICTARTRTVGDLVFLSRGQRLIWGTDETFCARHDGVKFNFVSTVLGDDARAVMPAAAQVGGRIVVTMRRRKSAVREGWVDAVHSDDGGATWSKPRMVGATGGRNGNPPALAALPDGRLVCCYGNRDFGSMVCSVSEDSGETWRAMLIRDGSEAHDNFKDIGYPQLFVRSDGTPICVYYWAYQETPQQHIAATEIAL